MLTLVTAPAESPVSLTEARAHCHADSNDDAMLQIYLDAAVASVDGADGVLGRCVVTQEWDYKLDCFPTEIVLPLPTLQTVTSVKYYDTAGVEQTWSAANYMVAGQRIVPVDAWPDFDSDRPYPITVRFVAGYGDAEEVPAQVKHLILLYVGDAFRNRDGAGEGGENPAIKRIIRLVKKWRV